MGSPAKREREGGWRFLGTPGTHTPSGLGKPAPLHLLSWPLQAGKNWMFSNAKSPPHCELMAGHLRNRITADGAHFELRLHLIYLINDVLHHW